MDIIGKKRIYFIISLLVIIPGILSLVFFGLHMSIDFVGGSRFTLIFPKTIPANSRSIVREVMTEDNIRIETMQVSGNTLIVRTLPLSQKQHAVITAHLTQRLPSFQEENFETIGPTISGETTTNALKAIGIACLLIVLYVAWSFRAVPKPASSWRFGVATIIALIHDLLVVVGIFSLLGHFFDVEVDILFVTALLTVLGFSVHDTIVVFDRIRENLRKTSGVPFSKVVNDAILQTLGRSLNTSLTVVLVLFALLLFGGESIKWFIVALLLGVISGTYSSIFNAAPLLVLWDELQKKK